MKDKPIVKVIFRKFIKPYKGMGGPREDLPYEVIAIFPEIFWHDRYGMAIQAYLHVGQHTTCDTAIAYQTKQAKPNEYADLLKELKGIYDDCELVIAKRLHSWRWYDTHKSLGLDNI